MVRSARVLTAPGRFESEIAELVAFYSTCNFHFSFHVYLLLFVPRFPLLSLTQLSWVIFVCTYRLSVRTPLAGLDVLVREHERIGARPAVSAKPAAPTMSPGAARLALRILVLDAVERLVDHAA